ncbi:MAG: hypothetical protein A4S09_08950 [Proteobacteria bacterium SG_bin7]|nr:MAG: hypothetical protein A4S09_08950 [Proteobacteria bacterium SG_bin7]
MHIHKKPVTRRDFLAQGFLLYSGVISLPNIFGLGLRKAVDQCGGSSGPNLTPFMVFDMAGGAALPGNFLVGKKGGPEDLLSSYNRLGWDPRQQGSLYKDFGLPMSLKYSKMLKGILDNTTAEARKNFRMGSFCHFAQDDSPSNRLNAANLVLSAGLRGSFITNGLGTIDSPSGGGSAPVVNNISLKPTIVNSVDGVLGAVNLGGPAYSEIKTEQIKAMAEATIDLSRIQKGDYIDLPDGKVLGDLSKCAYEKSLDFLAGIDSLDPRKNATVKAVYKINENTASSEVNAVTAALTMNSLMGQSGPGVWTLGNCDYHTGNSTDGDRQDELMGIQIGLAVELAHQMKKPLFFQLLTDGGCDANGERNWTGDSGDKCMTVIGYYKPNGTPKMRRTQVGHYTDGQGAERGTLIGSEPALVGYAVFANYLNICGKIDDFSTYAPGVFTGPGQLESVIIFEGKDS